VKDTPIFSLITFV